MSESSETHDCTALDYAYSPRGEDGLRGHITCWSDKKPRKGDYLILRNGEHSSRYRVTAVDLCMNVDPATMWMAELEFAPRVYADEARTIEVTHEGYPCGHVASTADCGGCDPAAIEYVIDEAGRMRRFDPTRDMQPRPVDADA